MLNRGLFALLAGAALPFAFAPFHLYWLAYLSPAILLACWLETTPRQAAGLGFLYGIGQFGVGVSWVFISIHEFGNTNIILAGLITTIMIAWLALFPMLQGYIFRKLFSASLLNLLFVFPALWALAEWLRSWLLSGFPWLLLGFSQTQGPLAPLAPILGAYGVSFMCCVLAASLIVALFRLRKKPQVSILILLFALSISAVSVSFRHHHWTQTSGKPINVALIQGNIAQQDVWTAAYFAKIIKTYLSLTTPVWKKSLIIWPESAIPAPESDVMEIVDGLANKAKENKSTLIFGIPIMNVEGTAYHNAMVSVGQYKNRYEKRHLVPFGEYLPFASLLRGLINFFNIPMSNMVPGQWQQAPFRIGPQQIAAFICYEIAYPNIVRSELPQANFLVTISNDAWFGHSLALSQHLQIAQFRSLQTGRWQAMVGNNGMTALIDAFGQIVKQLPPYQALSMTGKIQAMTGSTPWVKWGNLWLFITLLIGSLILGFFNPPRTILNTGFHRARE